MIQFPTTCVDNFFKYPDEIRRFGLSLDFKPEPKGMWPGTRSPEIGLVSAPLKRAICAKYLKLYLSPPTSWESRRHDIGYECGAHFQKINAKSGQGWVHNDTPHLHTSMIYLNPNANLNSGTSIYKPKEGVGPMISPRNNTKKRDFNLNKITAKEAEKSRLESNADFEETIRFSNIYNRCIGFDSSYWHAANEFAQKDEKDTRLTLIIFWFEISSAQTGLQRSGMEII